MLDIIRKKAKSWGTKIIFGIIILVFALFFGYNRITQRYLKGTKGGFVVATVNGSSITRPEFQLAYENTHKMYQQIFGKDNQNEPLPPEVEKSAKGSALRQLIQQKVMEKMGKKIGIEPTPFEIADIIRKSPVARGENGQFDPYLYKQRFLPYFARKYNIDYEYILTNELLSQKVQDIFNSANKTSASHEQYQLENTKWTFDLAEYENEAAAKSGKNGKPKKVGPITVAERGQLFTADPGIEAWDSIFAIIDKSSSIKNPIHAGEKWYTVKLAKFEKPTEEQWKKDEQNFTQNLAKRNGQEFLNTWISSLLKGAKIKTYLEE